MVTNHQSLCLIENYTCIPGGLLLYDAPSPKPWHFAWLRFDDGVQVKIRGYPVTWLQSPMIVAIKCGNWGSKRAPQYIKKKIEDYDVSLGPSRGNGQCKKTGIKAVLQRNKLGRWPCLDFRWLFVRIKFRWRVLLDGNIGIKRSKCGGENHLHVYIEGGFDNISLLVSKPPILMLLFFSPNQLKPTNCSLHYSCDFHSSFFPLWLQVILAKDGT